MSNAALAEVVSMPTKNSKLLVDSHNNLTEEFAKWMYKESRGGRVLSKEAICRQIGRLKVGSAPSSMVINVSGWISKAREYCENHLDCTLWNVPGEGWRVSTKRENAVYYAKSVKKTISWADRTVRLQLISDRKDIPGALREVFYKAEGGVKSLASTKKRYFQIWGDLLEKQPQKLLAGGK